MTAPIPQFIDTAGAVYGTEEKASVLNSLAPAYSYLVSGGIASAAAGLVVTQPATTAVIVDSSGIAVWRQVLATTVTLTSGAGTFDHYVYLKADGTYTTLRVNSGTAAPTAPAGALLLYYARSNAGNTAVLAYFDCAKRDPSAELGTGQLGINGNMAFDIRCDRETVDELDYVGSNIFTVVTCSGGRRVFIEFSGYFHDGPGTVDIYIDLCIKPDTSTGIDVSLTGLTGGSSYDATKGLAMVPGGTSQRVTVHALTPPQKAGQHRVMPVTVATILATPTWKCNRMSLTAFEV